MQSKYTYNVSMESELRNLRKQKGLTQSQCASVLNMPLRTYQYYESINHGAKKTYRLDDIIETLKKYKYVDEEHGLLDIETIKKECREVFKNYNVKDCYLFGSYAKGYATEKSDVDLYVDIDLKGIRLLAFIEEIREKLGKQIDLLTRDSVEANPQLGNEILLDGVKIYG